MLLVAAVLSVAYGNCSEMTPVQRSLSSQKNLLFKFENCTDESIKHENKTYVLGASEYINIAEDLFPGRDHSKLKELTRGLPVVPDVFDGNMELKAHEDFLVVREGIVSYFAAELKNKAEAECNPSEKNCRFQVLHPMIDSIFRRAVSGDELGQRIVDNMDLAFEDFAAMIFYSPEFHFKAYSNQLTPHEFVTKISLALFGSYADESLTQKKEDIFENSQVLREELFRLLQVPKNARRFSERFWKKWFSLGTLDTMELPETADFDKSASLEDFYRRLEEIVLSGGSLGDLFYRGANGVLPDSLLTHPSFSLASSRVQGDEVKSNYVHRGINIATNLLCQELPPLDPATMEELQEAINAAEGLTAFEAIEQHRSNPNCVSCHAIIDPVGVAMEHVSPFGSYRETFADGSPIVASGQFLGKDYQGLDSLVEIIADSSELRSCFVGRMKKLVDGPESEELSGCDSQEVFRQGQDLSVIDILTELFSSQRFTQRAISEEEVTMKSRELFVGDLYRYGLGREPDEGGFEHWLRVERTEGFLQVVKGVFLSAEMNNHQFSDTEFARRGYRAVAGYFPDAAELAQAAETLRDQGKVSFLEMLVNLEAVKKRFRLLLGESS